jgi:hypothetical protein
VKDSDDNVTPRSSMLYQTDDESKCDGDDVSEDIDRDSDTAEDEILTA